VAADSSLLSSENLEISGTSMLSDQAGSVLFTIQSVLILQFCTENDGWFCQDLKTDRSIKELDNKL
jgi:hypothetical protein